MRNWLQTCRRRAPVLVAVSLLCAAPSAAGQEPCTKFFDSHGNMGNLSWHVADNWTPVGVPGPTDVACVFDRGNYEVLVEEPVTVAGLRIEAPSEMGPRVKIIATDFTLNGDGFLAGDTKLKVNDGAVLRTDGDGWLEVHSKLVIEGGTVEIDVHLYGHLNWWGIGSITGALFTYPGSVIQVEDPMAPAHLTVADGFTINGSLVFNDAVDQSLTVTTGTLLNSDTGSITTVDGFGAAQDRPVLSAQLDNEGVIDVNGLDLRIVDEGVHHVNQGKGSIQVTDAELEIDLSSAVEASSNFTNYGTTTVAAGGTIRVIGSAGAGEASSNFTNYGTTTVATGGTIRVIGSAGATLETTPMTFVNFGFVDIDQGGLFEVIDAVYDNPASGRLGGSGLLDVTLAAAVLFDGRLSPGQSPGIFTVDGSIPFGPSASVAIEVGGETAGTELDRLDVTGDLAADGSLDVSLIGPYHPSGGERFTILTYGDLTGWFDEVTLPELQHLLDWNVDVAAGEVALDVICQGTQLGIELVPDRDPVSVAHEVVVLARVRNLSSVTATDLVVSSALPAELSYRADLSSPECVLIGSTVECPVAALEPAAVHDLLIAAEPVLAGTLQATGLVAAWECDTEPSDDQSTVTIRAVTAEPCDANDDLAIDADDLEPAVAHIFGATAPGNPDCRLANGVTADDLAAIIEASQ